MIKKGFTIMKILKKALSIAIILSCFISMFAYAAPTEKVYNSNEQNIYVAGKTDISNQTVTLLMKNQDNSIAYIDEGIAVNGNYSFKFKFKGNCQNCTLYIMDGSKNITETVLETRITGLYPLGNIDNTKISEDKKTISISANIKNLYNDAGNAKIIIAW